MLITMRFPKTKPKGKGLTPFGYVYNEDTKLLEAIPGHLETLEEALQLLGMEEIEERKLQKDAR